MRERISPPPVSWPAENHTLSSSTWPARFTTMRACAAGVDSFATSALMCSWSTPRDAKRGSGMTAAACAAAAPPGAGAPTAAAAVAAFLGSRRPPLKGHSQRVAAWSVVTISDSYGWPCIWFVT